ncbi:methyltransferase domain-containing protein [Nocardioides caldifontis]|uniref:methyltransferase domain-containing protein n=1 Tax=Nocardioides caldifontis TaxID=2588938 RepID=UPI0011DFE990|nr:methyltransferase domain-containing protein [Nocardioides caldifontis]
MPGRPNVATQRSAIRTAVVWEALSALLDSSPLEVLDVGGGTGGFAVRVAEQGHRVTVVDPSPDALATLGRRSEESAVADRITAVQGELATVPELLGRDSVDVVLCHGVLEVVDDPATAVAGITEVLRPGGGLSLLVGQRHAAVVARAMAGHFGQALELLTATSPAADEAPHRFTSDEVTALLTDAGFGGITLHAVRVFADLVPGALVDLEPGAAEALAELEHAVADRPEYLPLATQLHALARLG